MILLRWLITTLALVALPYLVTGISVGSITTALIVGACLVFIYLIIKPIVSILTLPINIITLGLFSLALNAVFFWLVSRVVDGFAVRTISAAIIGSLVISLVNWLTGRLKHDD
ncbi:phage holin family protein [Candidatus Nomurabacteria bacterium]|nr:phage holin family protein [Candidatus Nomurabacteria bacterium]